MHYFLLIPFYLLSIIPLRILYLFSDVLYFFVRFIFKYRETIIVGNLSSVFPEISEKEINRLKNMFYHQLTDLFVESLILYSISKKKILSLAECVENEDYFSMLEEPRGAVFLTGHRGNYEILGQYAGIKLKLPVYGVYRPFKSKIFEETWQTMRNRFNTRYIPDKEIVRHLITNINNGFYVTFLNDQKPTLGKKHLWVKFLGKDTLFFTAPEKIARKFNLPVYFVDMKRKKRGKYIVDVHLITKTPNELRENELIEIYTQKLEKAILDDPSNWLWSHKRWKH